MLFGFQWSISRGEEGAVTAGFGSSREVPHLGQNWNSAELISALHSIHFFNDWGVDEEGFCTDVGGDCNSTWAVPFSLCRWDDDDEEGLLRGRESRWWVSFIQYFIVLYSPSLEPNNADCCPSNYPYCSNAANNNPSNSPSTQRFLTFTYSIERGNESNGLYVPG